MDMGDFIAYILNYFLIQCDYESMSQRVGKQKGKLTSYLS